MKRGVIEAEKPKKAGGKQVAKTLGRTMAAFLAAGIALIALTDKTMSKAYPQENEEDE
ncbi:MAG: hypothetical protein MR440_03985 [Firmicutes bacterium]|nr:hypothetical protein [Bacillota bacterium]